MRFNSNVSVNMATPSGAYRHVIVESFEPTETSGPHGPVHIRPVKGQVYSPALFVSCSKRMSDINRHPVGTIFKLWAQLLTRESGAEWLYANPRDSEVVLSAKQAASFLAGLKHGHL